MGTFTALFWLKAIASALVFYFVNASRAKEFYYYQNLGVSRTLLWTVALTGDFALFMLSLIVTYKLK